MTAPVLEYPAQVIAQEIIDLKRSLKRLPVGSMRAETERQLEACEFVAALIELHSQFNGQPVL